jgi:hypothetical protein
MKKTVTLGLVALAIGSSVGIVAAEPDGRYRGRNGFTFGAALMAGQLGCTTRDGADCNSSGASEAGGLALRAGVMVQPNLAVALDLSGMTHREDRVKTSQTLAAITARGWLAPRLWLEGGVGIARSSAEYDLTVVNVVDDSENVLGGLVGVGFEVISSRNLALDVGLRGATSFYRNDVRLYNVALTVGVSFF